MLDEMLDTFASALTEGIVSHFYGLTRTAPIFPPQFFCYTQFSKLSFAAAKTIMTKFARWNFYCEKRNELENNGNEFKI